GGGQEPAAPRPTADAALACPAFRGGAGMNCHDLVDRLIDYVSGELSADEIEDIRRHLDTCPPGVYYVETYQLTIKLTRRRPGEPAPPTLLARLRAAAQQPESEA